MRQISGVLSLVVAYQSVFRHFNTNKVNNSETMFNYCIELTTIYCNDAWDCEESDYMFASCNKLVGGNDSETTDIDAINTDASDANWYTLDGKVLNGMPSQKGMYIHGGKTVMIK
jgi:hypothetical protein